MKELKRKITNVLTVEGNEFKEIAKKLGISGRDLVTLRRTLVELVKEGKVIKEPDYKKKRHIFRINKNKLT